MPADVFQRLSSPPRQPQDHPRSGRQQAHPSSGRRVGARLNSPTRHRCAGSHSASGHGPLQETGNIAALGTRQRLSSPQARPRHCISTPRQDTAVPDVFVRLSSPPRQRKTSRVRQRFVQPDISPAKTASQNRIVGKSASALAPGSVLKVPSRDKLAKIFDRHDSHGNGFLALTEIEHVGGLSRKIAVASD